MTPRSDPHTAREARRAELERMGATKDQAYGMALEEALAAAEARVTQLEGERDALSIRLSNSAHDCLAYRDVLREIAESDAVTLGRMIGADHKLTPYEWARFVARSALGVVADGGGACRCGHPHVEEPSGLGACTVETCSCAYHSGLWADGGGGRPGWVRTFGPLVRKEASDVE